MQYHHVQDHHKHIMKNNTHIHILEHPPKTSLKANQWNVQVDSHTPTQTKLDPLGYPSQTSSPLIHFTFWEHLALTYIYHMSQCEIRCHKTLHRKKTDCMPRQYENMKHSTYVDLLASILMEETQFKNQEIQLGPSLCAMHYSLQSQE